MTVAAEATAASQASGALGATADTLPVTVAAITPIANASDVSFESIRRALVEGRFAPGARLREVALAQQLGISPTPVREEHGLEPWTCPPFAFILAEHGVSRHGITVLPPSQAGQGSMRFSL